MAPVITPSTMSWSESAYEWMQRSQRKRIERQTPLDPSSAAWKFVRPYTPFAEGGGEGGGTGIAFVDASIRHQSPDRLPVVDIRGYSGSGKTWTLLTMAAKFVTQTRLSKFDRVHNMDINSDKLEPRVFFFDSTYNVTASKLAYVVRSMLLLQPSNNSNFQHDMKSCLERIHIVTVSCIADWVPILELVRIELLAPKKESSSALPDGCPPALFLWDGFLSEPANEAQRSEVILQLNRILEMSSVLFAATTSKLYRLHEWDKHITHRIRLETRIDRNSHKNYYVATIAGNKSGERMIFPFAVSLAGVRT